jgi:hypothetical protein
MSETLRVSRVLVIQGRAYGPADHVIEDREIARQLRARGAQRLVGNQAVDASAPESVDELTGPIPEKFPYRVKLEENGVTTLDRLVAMSRSELTQLDGIAELSADKIQQALEDLVEDMKAGAGE